MVGLVSAGLWTNSNQLHHAFLLGTHHSCGDLGRDGSEPALTPVSTQCLRPSYKNMPCSSQLITPFYLPLPHEKLPWP